VPGQGACLLAPPLSSVHLAIERDRCAQETHPIGYGLCQSGRRHTRQSRRHKRKVLGAGASPESFGKMPAKPAGLAVWHNSGLRAWPRVPSQRGIAGFRGSARGRWAFCSEAWRPTRGGQYPFPPSRERWLPSTPQKQPAHDGKGRQGWRCDNREASAWPMAQPPLPADQAIFIFDSLSSLSVG
jgi:hypothetical protein